MVRGRRTHHRRGRTPPCRRPRPHLDRSPPRRSLTTGLQKLSWRSPARDSRWRTTSPEDTSIGAVPV